MGDWSIMDKDIKEIQLRLKAPMIALERLSNGRYLPQVFAEVAFNELWEIQRLTEKMIGKRKQRKKHV